MSWLQLTPLVAGVLAVTLIKNRAHVRGAATRDPRSGWLALLLGAAMLLVLSWFVGFGETIRGLAAVLLAVLLVPLFQGLFGLIDDLRFRARVRAYHGNDDDPR